MGAKDGLTFYVFTTSEDLRRWLKADGFSPIPTSPDTIMMVIYLKENSRKKMAEIKTDISDSFKSASSRNRRYMNLILHGKGSKIWNLELVRCKSSMIAEKLLDAVIKKIEWFRLING